MKFSEVENYCETYFSNVAYLFMIAFFVIGYFFFSHIKVSSSNTIIKDNEKEISRINDFDFTLYKDDKIRSFFVEIDEFKTNPRTD